MTDDTRSRTRPFVDTGGTPETTGDEQAERSSAFERADRTPVGTAESTRPAADQTTQNRTTGVGSGSDPSAEPDTDSAADPDAGRDDDRLEQRLRAVERAITGTDDAVADLGDEANASAEREALSTRLDDLEARVEELEAATQAIRGYVGSVRSVNQAVERRADLALAKASEGDGAAENQNAVSDDDSDEMVSSGVPSETDLDAAVPTDKRRGDGARSTVGPAGGSLETNDEKTDSSWRDSALDRLRDTL